jgi:hypothetical protein
MYSMKPLETRTRGSLTISLTMQRSCNSLAGFIINLERLLPIRTKRWHT